MIDEKMEFTFDCWDMLDGIPQRKHITAFRSKQAIEIFKRENPTYGFDSPYIDY